MLRSYVRSRAVPLVLRRSKSSINSVNKLTTADERKHSKYEKRKEVDIEWFQKRKCLNTQYLESIKNISTNQIVESWDAGDSYYDGINNIHDLKAQNFHYYNPILPDVTAMVTDMINTVLIELNLRKVFLGDVKDSKILIQDVGSLLLKNKELIKQLYLYYDNPDSQLPQDLELFLTGLNKPQLRQLLDSIAENPSFSSLRHFRTFFSYNKTGNHSNYEESETTRFTKNSLSGYTKRHPDDDVLILELNEIFCVPKLGLDQLSKVDTILKVISQMINSPSPPGLDYFIAVLNHLNNHYLTSYQTIMLKYMIPIKFRPSLLSQEDTLNQRSDLPLFYFKSIVEKRPDFISTLFNYYAKVGNDVMIEKLLSYLKLDEVIDLEKIFNRSIYNQLLSKSRFIKNRSLNQLTPITYSNPVIIKYDTLINAINKCVQFEKFEYVDLLINKLILHSNLDREIFLSINESLDLSNFKFVIDNDNEDLSEVLLFLFDRDLMIILLKLVMQSNDMGRLMWLIPNLDIFVERNLSLDKILDLKHHMDDGNDDFFGLNESLQVNMSLIYNIHKCLKQFGLDGKVLHYEKIFGIGSELVLNNEFISSCK